VKRKIKNGTPQWKKRAVARDSASINIRCLRLVKKEAENWKPAETESSENLVRNNRVREKRLKKKNMFGNPAVSHEHRKKNAGPSGGLDLKVYRGKELNVTMLREEENQAMRGKRIGTPVQENVLGRFGNARDHKSAHRYGRGAPWNPRTLSVRRGLEEECQGGIAKVETSGGKKKRPKKKLLEPVGPSLTPRTRERNEK